MSAPQSFGRYQVIGTLGKGGMGEVYLAEDPVIGRQVAIKSITLRENLGSEEIADAQARFQREFQVAGSLSHPNIVTVYDVGEHRSSWFIAMERMGGEDLCDAFKNEGMAVTLVCELAKQIGAALDFAHSKGVVHRDIKPANILFSLEGTPKIADFGIAKLAASELTASGKILGTPWYMAPEQISGHDVTPASDQFSFAVMLYEALTGTKPFNGKTTTEIAYNIVHTSPRAPRAVREELPGTIDTVILKGLARNPWDRFDNCTDLANALVAAAMGLESDLVGDVPAAYETSAFGIDDFNLDEPAEALTHEDTLDQSTEVIEVEVEANERSWRLPGIVATLAVAAVLVFIALPERGSEEQLPPPTIRRAVAVEASETGIAIFIDGRDSGQTTPAVIELEGPPGEEIYLSMRVGEYTVAAQIFELGEQTPKVWSPTLDELPDLPGEILGLSE